MTDNKPVIFCDFDGTITNSDNIIAIMEEFAPEEWETIKNQVLSQEISIRKGVGKMFSLLLSKNKKKITSYILNHAEIRAGFSEFVSYTKQHDIPLYIVSGGIDFFVEPLINGYVDKENIYCNRADFANETISIDWPHSCDYACFNDCGCCKPSIIRRLSNENTKKIIIGDSITDFEAAKLADQVIARDFLIEKCQEESIAYHAFQTFYDVIDILEKQEVAV